MINLRDNCQFGVSLDSFFPRTYEIGSDIEKMEFIKEYDIN